MVHSSGSIWKCPACRRSVRRGVTAMAVVLLAICALALSGCIRFPAQPCYDIELNPRTGTAIVIDHCQGTLGVRHYNPSDFGPTTSTTLQPSY